MQILPWYRVEEPMCGTDGDPEPRKRGTDGDPEPRRPLPVKDMGHRLVRCPYRQDLKLFCGEDCGKGTAADCPIWLRGS